MLATDSHNLADAALEEQNMVFQRPDGPAVPPIFKTVMDQPRLIASNFYWVWLYVLNQVQAVIRHSGGYLGCFFSQATSVVTLSDLLLHRGEVDHYHSIQLQL